jgi:PAS domain S-box-containing protein
MNVGSGKEPRQPFWRWNSPWAAGLLLFTAYVAISIGTLVFIYYRVDPMLRVLSIASPWLAVGVGVLGIKRGGARLWPALFLGSWVVWGVFVHDPPTTVTIDALAETASIVLIARLLAMWDFHRSFDRLRDPLILLAAATIGRILDSAFDLGASLATAWMAPDSIAPLYRPLFTDATGAFPVLTGAVVTSAIGWSLNSIAGIMLVVPLAGARLRDLPQTCIAQPGAALVLAVGLPAWSIAALSLPAFAAQPLLISALMLVAWAAVRFGPSTAAFATLVMSVVANAGVGMRIGPLASANAMDSLALQWGFIALLMLTGLSLTALLAARRRDTNHLKAVAERYERLFRVNPSPLWVAEPGGGRILMVNDEAIRRYGFSEREFLAMTVNQLAAEPVATPVPQAAAGLAHPVRHRTRGGALIEVELLSTPIELDGRAAELCYAVDVTDRFDLRARIGAVADLERERLVQDLHDGLGQVLTGLNFGVDAAAARVARGTQIDRAFIDFLLDASNRAIEMCRQLTRGVSPLQDANGDLIEALRRLPQSLPPGAATRLEIAVESQAPLTLSLERSEHLYGVVQEAVSNALKHAHATHIRVRIAVSAQNVQVDIKDDGIGIKAAARASDGLGMRSMSLRAAAVGATVEVREGPHGGTVVRCECPQQEAVPSPGAVEPAEAAPTLNHHAASAPPDPAGAAARRSATAAYLGRVALLAAGCFVGLAISISLAGVVDPRIGMGGDRVGIPSLADGFGLAGLLLGGARLWPGIALGMLIAARVLLLEPWPAAIYYSAGSVLAALVMFEFLSRWNFRRGFDHWQDPLLLISAAIIGGSVLSVLDFSALMTIQWLHPGEIGPRIAALVTNESGATPVVTGAFLAALAHWWADSVSGVVIFVPLLVATPPILRTLRGHRGEAAAWCVALLGWVGCMFMLHEVAARLPLVAVALLLLVWAVVRFGVAMASVATCVCAISATLSFMLQRGVLTTVGVDEGIETLWGFLALLTITGLFLTGLLAERNRTLLELDALARRYRRLFARDPHPLWLQDLESGRILMVNEAAIRHYGYTEAEWLTLSAERLGPQPAGKPAGAGGAENRPFETRHRLKSGASIDVELSFAPLDIDGRPALVCFAVDVTERNILRLGLIEAKDQERRRLANELRRGIGRALADLEVAAVHLEERARSAQVDSAALDQVARASRRAASVCRDTAHAVAAAV